MNNTGVHFYLKYVKIATHQWLDDEAVLKVGPPASRQSVAEGLDGHMKAAQVRVDRLNQVRGG